MDFAVWMYLLYEILVKLMLRINIVFILFLEIIYILCNHKECFYLFTGVSY